MKLELATTPEQLAKGLQFRESMPDNHAMLLCFDKPQRVSIHMHNVKFPLDILFMNKYCMPLKSVRNAQPETEGYECDNVKYVLETASRAHQMKLDSSKQSSKGLLKEEDLYKPEMIEYNWSKNSLGEYEGKSGKFTALNDEAAIRKAASELTEALNKATGLKFMYKLKDKILADQFGIFLNNKQYARGHVELHLMNDNYTAHYGLRLEGYRNAQRGMPEDVQHAKLKGWEQAEIMDPKKRDWIDDEAELGVYGIDEKQLKNLLGQESTTEEDEDIDPADLGVDMSLAETRLDSTQKYLPAEQKLYRENYWKEKRMTHKIEKEKHMKSKEAIIDTVLKEAVSPPGWSKTVEKMKRHKEIDNPWALAYWMKNKGYKPHYKERKKSK